MEPDDTKKWPIENSVFDVPLIFADSLSHISTSNGVARMTFTQTLADPLDSPKGDEGFRGRNVVSIAIPVHQLLSLARYLEQTIGNFKKQKILPEGD